MRGEKGLFNEMARTGRGLRGPFFYLYLLTLILSSVFIQSLLPLTVKYSRLLAQTHVKCESLNKQVDPRPKMTVSQKNYSHKIKKLN